MTDKLRGALAACARFAKREAVFTAALLLALGSLFLVPQNESPLPWSAIDWDTLALLFSLMAVMKGAQRLGLFAYCGSVLLRRTKSTRQMMSVLVFLPFFCSMAITNDVALITFVPFAITVLRMAEQEKLLIPVVALQTLAANLGSMLTPLGNPQNLYLYRLSGLRLSAFLTLMLPYVLLSGGALALLLVFRRRESLRFTPAEVRPGNTRGLLCCALGFVLCMLALAELLPLRRSSCFFCCLPTEACFARWTIPCSAPFLPFSFSSAIWSVWSRSGFGCVRRWPGTNCRRPS